MSQIKLDKFTIILISVLIICAGMLIFTFRGIFNAFSIANDTTFDVTDAVRVDEQKLKTAKEFTLGQKTIVPLNIKESKISVNVTVTPKPTP